MLANASVSVSVHVQRRLLERGPLTSLSQLDAFFCWGGGTAGQASVRSDA